MCLLYLFAPALLGLLNAPLADHLEELGGVGEVCQGIDVSPVNHRLPKAARLEVAIDDGFVQFDHIQRLCVPGWRGRRHSQPRKHVPLP